MADRRPWLKWYPADWRAEPTLRMCSRAARSLWLDMLGLMHDGEPYGHLTVSGIVPTPKQLASLLGDTERETLRLLAELEAAGVFSRDDSGRIFCRRMLRDKAREDRDRANGKWGGNPAIVRAVNGGVNPQTSEGVNGVDKAHMPEARDQRPERKKESPPPSGAPSTVVDPTGMQQAVDEWNRLAPALGLATTRWPLSKDRAQKLRARLTDCGGIEGWLAALEKVRRSPLLNGTASRSGRHANWRCSFDFLIRAEAFERLMEGKYDGRSGLADIAEQHAAIDRALGLEAGG